MYELWYHTPTRTYVERQGTYEEMLAYAKQEKLPPMWGYFFTIRLNGLALKKIGSQLKSWEFQIALDK